MCPLSTVEPNSAFLKIKCVLNSFHSPCLLRCVSSLPWWVGMPDMLVEPSRSLPLWGVRLTAWPVWERTFRGLTHNLPSSPTPVLQWELLGVQMGIAKLCAAVLPGSLYLALTWVPGWPLHTCVSQACTCSDPSHQNTRATRPLKPTHMLGSPTLCFFPHSYTMVPAPGV